MHGHDLVDQELQVLLQGGRSQIRVDCVVAAGQHVGAVGDHILGGAMEHAVDAGDVFDLLGRVQNRSSRVVLWIADRADRSQSIALVATVEMDGALVVAKRQPLAVLVEPGMTIDCPVDEQIVASEIGRQRLVADHQTRLVLEELVVDPGGVLDDRGIVLGDGHGRI